MSSHRGQPIKRALRCSVTSIKNFSIKYFFGFSTPYTRGVYTQGNDRQYNVHCSSPRCCANNKSSWAIGAATAEP